MNQKIIISLSWTLPFIFFILLHKKRRKNYDKNRTKHLRFGYICLGWVDFPNSSIFILHLFVHIKIYIKCTLNRLCMVLDINYLIVCKVYEAKIVHPVLTNTKKRKQIILEIPCKDISSLKKNKKISKIKSNPVFTKEKKKNAITYKLWFYIVLVRF